MQDIHDDYNKQYTLMFDVKTLTCYVCNYTATTKSNFKNHLYSMKHHKNVEKINEENQTDNEQDITSGYKPTFSETTIVQSSPDKINDTLVDPLEPEPPKRTRKRSTKNIKNTDEKTNTSSRHNKQETFTKEKNRKLDVVSDVHEPAIDEKTVLTAIHAISTGLFLTAIYFIYTYSN